MLCIYLHWCFRCCNLEDMFLMFVNCLISSFNFLTCSTRRFIVFVQDYVSWHSGNEVLCTYLCSINDSTCINVLVRKKYIGMLLDVQWISLCSLHGVECLGWCCIMSDVDFLRNFSSLANKVLFSNLCCDLNYICQILRECVKFHLGPTFGVWGSTMSLFIQMLSLWFD